MTQTKRKRSVIATGDLHLRESLSIGPSFTMRLRRPLHIVETFSHPKISSIRKHFPTCKDILTREATKHKERIVSTSFLSRQNVIFENIPIKLRMSLITRLLFHLINFSSLLSYDIL